MNFGEAMDAYGQPINDKEAFDAIRAERGSGAARWLAEQLGISARQARRYLAGEVKRVSSARSAKVRDSAPKQRVAAAALRKARTLSVGHVKVTVKSPTSGQPAEQRRDIKPKRVTKAARAKLDQAADKLDAGDIEEAERFINEAIGEAYGSGGAFTITDYIDGFLTD